jgi:PAS domain S-box-containing protein
MSLFRGFSGVEVMSDGGPAPLWAWVTMSLSALVALGYCVIAVNWYFQKKIGTRRESRAALNRLLVIFASCAACGAALSLVELPWPAWRAYDLALLLLACHTWVFVFRMRGLGLVDERLAQLEELERSANRYREIAELLPDMVWTATADGVVDYANQRWREYAGTGDPRTWLDALHPHERREVLAAWAKALVAREPVSLEVRLAGGGGEYRSFVVRATPIVHGDAVKWLGACADVEDQKQLAQEKELQARQKSFFLNALSHDLRAPLHNVLLHAHLLKMTAREEADAESVKMIMENAVAAGDLVARLLDFAKVGAHDHNVTELVPLAPAVRQLLRRFQPRAAQRGLCLKLDGDAAADAAVVTDRQKLDRILSNLVDNAIKYTSRGGVSVELATSGGECAVRVTDTGIGIPPENVPFLFDEFYQVNNYERDRSKGFGMGLAICRCLARHLGGDVRLVATRAGAGSCFELTLPAASAAASASVASADPGVGADRGGRPGGADGDRPDPQAAGLCGV